MVLFASDLDNTLIFSYKQEIKSDDVLVESKDGKKLSYMTKYAYDTLQQINKVMEFVPITTRSTEQYLRINLIENSFPRLAITSNGAVLLRNNKIDEQWAKESMALVCDLLADMENYKALLEAHEYTDFDVRIVDNAFIFTKSANIEKTMELLKGHVRLDLFDVFNIGIKAYIFPKVFNKGNALKRLKKLVGADGVLCAGDSYIDLPMLKEADFPLVPKGYEWIEDGFRVCQEKYFSEFVVKEALRISGMKI